MIYLSCPYTHCDGSQMFYFLNGIYHSKPSDYLPLISDYCSGYLYAMGGRNIKVLDEHGLLLDASLFNNNRNGESFVKEVDATRHDKMQYAQSVPHYHGRLACITDDKMIHVFDNDFGHMKFDINFKRIA